MAQLVPAATASECERGGVLGGPLLAASTIPPAPLRLSLLDFPKEPKYYPSAPHARKIPSPMPLQARAAGAARPEKEESPVQFEQLLVD